ncbi:MAG: o-succinylbenzoate synthase [Acidimicrobiia bacterium]
MDGVSLHPVRVPLRHRFRGVTFRDAVLLRGPAGWGEFSPFPDYRAEAAARWLAAAREAAEEGWPEPRRERIPVNVAIPAVAPETAYRLAVESGCRTAKVKVAEPGQSLADDLDRVAAVREALGPEGRVRVDANGAWDVETAVDALGRLDAHHLEYAEQPVATLEEMADLRRRVGVALAADESIRTADDPLGVAGLEAVDVLVLKVHPMGGVRRCLEVAQAAGLPVVVSSAVETSVGLAAGLALAATLPELPFACGLGTGLLLAGDVVADPLLPELGEVPVRRPEPAAELIERWAPPTADGEAMLDRLAVVMAMSE